MVSLERALWVTHRRVIEGNLGPRANRSSAATRYPYSNSPSPSQIAQIRHRTDRTKALAFEQVREQANAFEFADRQGRPLTVAMTVVWNLMADFNEAGWEERWSAIQTRFMKSIARWMSHRGIEPTWIWSRECSKSLWWHTHIQLHLPRAANGKRTGTLARELAAHLESSFSFAPGGIYLSFGTFGMWTKPMRCGELIYQLKGVDHRAYTIDNTGETVNIGSALGIEHRGNQGHIPLKRAGTTENIGAAARRRVAWLERSSLDDLRQIIRPPEVKHQGVILGRRGLQQIILKSRRPAARSPSNRKRF